jgi:hypothetical protein
LRPLLFYKVRNIRYRIALRKIEFVVLSFFILESCYKEQILFPGGTGTSFNFSMTGEQESAILEARGQRLLVDTPVPVLTYNNNKYNLDRFQIRGESTLYFRRKSFSVNMDDPFLIYVKSEGGYRDFEKYKLISLVFDYTYIENCMTIGLDRVIHLWPTFSFYTEVKLNNDTQGVYLFIEDPDSYFLDQLGASFILRRNYNHRISGYQTNDLINPAEADNYIARFDSIYTLIATYSGKQLYDSLTHLMDMPQYFAKLSIDMLVMNGDCTDEIFFYTKVVNGREVFGVYPWDYDDLFSSKPHEIGRNWAVGTVFGTRTYSSIDDIINDVGEKLLFSIEDDLDYAIARDDYLYGQYLLELSAVMNALNTDVINAVFDSVYDQIRPFYNNDDIIAQSKYDADETNLGLFEENIANKRQVILDRREWIIQKLNEKINSNAK